jgi:hypothetical protein
MRRTRAATERRFNGLYRVRRNVQWQRTFYTLLEAQKTRRALEFPSMTDLTPTDLLAEIRRSRAHPLDVADARDDAIPTIGGMNGEFATSSPFGVINRLGIMRRGAPR